MVLSEFLVAPWKNKPAPPRFLKTAGVSGSDWLKDGVEPLSNLYIIIVPIEVVVDSPVEMMAYITLNYSCID
jgi:hypothetical protein